MKLEIIDISFEEDSLLVGFNHLKEYVEYKGVTMDDIVSYLDLPILDDDLPDYVADFDPSEEEKKDFYLNHVLPNYSSKNIAAW